MKLYAAIDLHSNNGVLSILDEEDRLLFERRLPNELTVVLEALAPYRDQLVAVAVESTYNWYWLVDGLMEHGYHVRLVNTAAVPQYEGIKHGPLALVDADMPVIAVAPNDHLIDKLSSNMEEVRARGGRLYLFVEQGIKHGLQGESVLTLPKCGEISAPVLFTIPLQLLAYHVAVLRGTDVDQPRNLAKSVTVE
ncbi:MAG: SIS domain-containing protein [Xanthomonadaceae bacterium]|nr:SIS domain-containing protein [Xanthomonadaceae bacterium]